MTSYRDALAAAHARIEMLERALEDAGADEEARALARAERIRLAGEVERLELELQTEREMRKTEREMLEAKAQSDAARAGFERGWVKYAVAARAVMEAAFAGCSRCALLLSIFPPEVFACARTDTRRRGAPIRVEKGQDALGEAYGLPYDGYDGTRCPECGRYWQFDEYQDRLSGPASSDVWTDLPALARLEEGRPK